MRLAGAALVVAGAGLGAVAATTPAGAASGPSIAGTGAPLPPDASPSANSFVTGTSCAAAGNCVSVGAYQTGPSAASGLIETLSDGTWTALEAPVPAGGSNGELFGVSCPAVGQCAASGSYVDGSGNRQAEALVLSQGTWTATGIAAPADAATNPNVALVNISCPTIGTCVAGGFYENSGPFTEGLLVTQSGGSWTAVSAPLPAGAASPAHSFVLNVACSGPGSCEAVGQYTDALSHTQVLLDALSGGTWAATAVTLPAGADPAAGAALEGVACPKSGPCTGVGGYTNTGGDVVPLVVTGSGGGAVATEGPLPPDAAASGSGEDVLFSVACPSSTACQAVGTYVAQSNTGTGTSPLIATQSGSSWSAIRGPGSFDPAGHTALVGVSCSWPGSCTAFGTSATTGSQSGVVETLSNGNWTESSSVLPANSLSPPAVQVGLGMGFFGNAISCSGGTCAMGGMYETTTMLTAGFLNWTPNLGGYQLVASDGGLFSYNAPFYGSMGGTPLNKPVVGMAVVPDSGAYYEVASDGGIFAFGAPFQGSMGGQHLNAPIVGMAFDTMTGGYYLVASDGGIFAFGAPFQGSMGGQHLNKPIVGMAFDPASGGYYLVASDGGIFAFGGAKFQGSTGAIVLNKPVVGMSVDVDTGGYYLVASDGGIFAFGAPFQGSMGGAHLNKPAVGMATDFATGGYYLVASDGGIFAFGRAPFQGSAGNLVLNQPVVGMGFG